MTTSRKPHRNMNRLCRALVASGVLMAGTLMGATPPVAEASVGNCPTTKFCTWDNSGYPGSPNDTYNAPSSGNASIHYKSRFNGTYYKTLISTQANGAGTTTCIPPRHGYSFGSTQYHNYRLITAGYVC